MMQSFFTPVALPVPADANQKRIDPKLVSAAHEFEASLMQELLKPMQSDSLFGEDSDSPEESIGGLTSSADGSQSALMSFGSEAMAKALSEKGGLGIASRILDHFEHSGAAEGRSGNSETGLQTLLK